jgi:hypothetical protein
VRYDEETGASVVTGSEQPTLDLTEGATVEPDDDVYERVEATG